jgi:hypothetical protein
MHTRTDLQGYGGFRLQLHGDPAQLGHLRLQLDEQALTWLSTHVDDERLTALGGEAAVLAVLFGAVYCRTGGEVEVFMEPEKQRLVVRPDNVYQSIVIEFDEVGLVTSVAIHKEHTPA